MSFAKNLLDELVNKRLWPIALALLAAIVAFPVLLGGGGGSADDAAQAPAAAATEERASANAVDLVGPPSVRSRPDTGRDPFRRPRPKKASAEGTSAGASQAPSTTGGAPAQPAGSTGGASGPAHAPSPAPIRPPAAQRPMAPVQSPYAYRTSVRWGAQTGGVRTRTRGIARLTPLGLLDDPALLYLGVSKDGRWATFLLGPHATSTGKAWCLDEACRIIGLKPGMSQTVDVISPGVMTYQRHIDVVSIERVALIGPAAGRKARAHVHPEGRRVLRKLIESGRAGKALGALAYEQDLGVLTGLPAAP